MTGEITLSGNVLPIGGVKEKGSGCEKRAGVTTVLLPSEKPGRKRDRRTWSLPQIEGVAIHYVSNIAEALGAGASAISRWKREERCGGP